jgi:hypothetical protein
MNELKEEKEKHEDTKVELAQKTQELARHHQTKVELDKKTDELHNAEIQCEGYRLAFRTHRDTLKKKDKAAFDGLVSMQLESTMIQGAKMCVKWHTKKANDAERQAAELQENAAEERAKALSIVQKFSLEEPVSKKQKRAGT